MPELFEPAEMRLSHKSNPTESVGPISTEFEDSVLSDLEVPLNASGEDGEDEIQAAQETALAKPDRTTAWSSAASAREFLEQIAPAQRSGTLARFWRSEELRVGK